MENVCLKTREEVEVGCSKEQELEQFISEVFDAVIDTFRFTEEELQRFKKSKVANLVAAIPYVAGCEEAKRTALAHLSVYITELRGGSVIFDHCEDDNNSVYTRLRLISSFKGGDEKVIRQGMNLLSLCMIDGYKKSANDDIVNNIYNPLNDGVWNYNYLKASLLNEISENPCVALDTLIVNTDGDVEGPWA